MSEATAAYRQDAKRAAERARAIQEQADKAEKRRSKANGKKDENGKAPHTRDRKYPESPLPPQH